MNRDTSEEQRPRISREAIEAAIEAADLGTWELDLITDTVTVRSLRHDQMFGYSELQPTWTPAIAERHVIEEDRAAFRDSLARGRETGVLAFEFRVRWPDGSIHWIAPYGRTFRDADGKPVRMAGVVADITERKRNEEALRASEERRGFLLALSDALRDLADPIEIQAEASRRLGQHLNANRVNYAEINGDVGIIRRGYVHGVAPMVGRFPLRAFGEKLLGVYRQGDPASIENIETDPRLTESERARFREVEIAAYCTVMLIKDSELRAMFGAHSATPRAWTHDEIELTREVAERTWAAAERARAEAALADQRRLYESVLNTTPDLVYIFDRNHRFIYANDGLLTMWGKTHEEALGKTCLELGYEPWHAEMHDREIDQVFATGQPVRGEVPFAGTFGRRIYDYILTPVFDASGRVNRVAGTTRDVTDYRQAQEALRDADQRKDEFLATLAHELRNPLAPIRTSVHVLKLHATENTTDVCEMMERQISHMVRLIDDLMEVSRITRGKIELHREDADLASVVQTSIDAVKPLVDHSRHQLVVRVPEGPILVNVDPVRLAQVISNLLNNAAKYTDPGGTIWLTAERCDSEIVVSVRDTGIGIPSDKLNVIFEMFAQAHRSIDRVQDGLGIGLTLASRIVEMHGGAISAHSDGPGYGSEFVVRLPVLDRVPEVSRPSEPRELVNHRVLVVDDNRDAASSLAMLVKRLGSEVFTAYDGPTALEMIESRHPDIVLLDLGMPGMDGFEVARQIRRRHEFDDTKLVALTGWGQERDRELTREAGFDSHLVKPAELDALQDLFAVR